MVPARITVDFTSIQVPKVESTVMDMHETDDFIRDQIGRKIVVIGASTRDRLHTLLE